MSRMNGKKKNTHTIRLLEKATEIFKKGSFFLMHFLLPLYPEEPMVAGGISAVKAAAMQSLRGDLINPGLVQLRLTVTAKEKGGSSGG